MVKIALFLLSLALVMFFVPGVAVCAKAPPGWAVLVIDVQPCFVEAEEGALAVSGTDKAYVKKVKQDTKWFHQKGYMILGSRDYHPEDHISFNTYDPPGLWPPHCVQTAGDSRALVDNNLFFELVKKGQDPLFDSYSAFKDDGGAETELHAILQAQGIQNLIVYGIATDYCVYYSVLDAITLGYNVIVVEDLNRGVAQGTTTDAIADMTAKGAEFVTNAKAAHKRALAPTE